MNRRSSTRLATKASTATTTSGEEAEASGESTGETLATPPAPKVAAKKKKAFAPLVFSPPPPGSRPKSGTKSATSPSSSSSASSKGSTPPSGGQATATKQTGKAAAKTITSASSDIEAIKEESVPAWNPVEQQSSTNVAAPTTVATPKAVVSASDTSVDSSTPTGTAPAARKGLKVGDRKLDRMNKSTDPLFALPTELPSKRVSRPSARLMASWGLQDDEEAGSLRAKHVKTPKGAAAGKSPLKAAAGGGGKASTPASIITSDLPAPASSAKAPRRSRTSKAVVVKEEIADPEETINSAIAATIAAAHSSPATFKVPTVPPLPPPPPPVSTFTNQRTGTAYQPRRGYQPLNTQRAGGVMPRILGPTRVQKAKAANANAANKGHLMKPRRPMQANSVNSGSDGSRRQQVTPEELLQFQLAQKRRRELMALQQQAGQNQANGSRPQSASTLVQHRPPFKNAAAALYPQVLLQQQQQNQNQNQVQQMMARKQQQQLQQNPKLGNRPAAGKPKPKPKPKAPFHEVHNTLMDVLSIKSTMAIKNNFPAWLNGELKLLFPAERMHPLAHLPTHVAHWTAEHVAVFVRAVGFPKVAQVMLDGEVDGTALLLLKFADIAPLFKLKAPSDSALYSYLVRLHQNLYNIVMPTAGANSQWATVRHPWERGYQLPPGRVGPVQLASSSAAASAAPQ